jgi:hypothetical protein
VATPVTVGVNRTATVQVPPALSIWPVQTLLKAVNSAALAPVSVAALSGPVGDPPVFVTVKESDSFEVPTTTEPKPKLVGAIDSAAVEGVPVPEIAAITVPPGMALN